MLSPSSIAVCGLLLSPRIAGWGESDKFISCVAGVGGRRGVFQFHAWPQSGGGSGGVTERGTTVASATGVLTAAAAAAVAAAKATRVT